MPYRHPYVSACGEFFYPYVADPRRSQNKVEEFFSLVHFLRIKPLNDWGTFKQRIIDSLKKGRTKAPMKRLHVRFSSSQFLDDFSRQTPIF